MLNTSQILLSKSALKHNLEFIRKTIGPETILSSVVKGNAYGHGIEQYVPLAKACGMDHFSVFSANEAYRVHQSLSDSTPIMIMGMIDDDQMEWVIQNGVSFFVFEKDRLESAAKIARKLNRPAKIHIEIESGMNRTGFSTRVLTDILKYIQKEAKHLIVEGLCTHFAGAESIANYHRIKKQESIYRRAHKRMLDFGIAPQLKHTACSAATIRYPKTIMDMARIGILQYGFFPNQETLIHYMTKQKVLEYPLRRVISWKSKVMNVKTVKRGEFIGYGTSFLANSDMKVAVIPVGYGHGFSRLLSNQGIVLIHGQRVSVAGTVNMNMMSVDVTNLDGVQKGDEAVIIGKQGELEISVASFSDFSDQVNYELLTRLPGDIPRFIVD
ncbi:MAG: alanine racemase [Bacteroidetes bacterium]|nr:MAG: alanine racemase [Bacteroidota bacterium]